ncbi:MAG: RNA 2',3'-cyclic phosphodiesterase [Thermotogota bacterium]|nr:RNA 2',3'-cyclic phosphodiesterase [Thermotogota bacterium]
MRCFIALGVGENVKQQCHTHIVALKKIGFHAKWVEQENLHITLFFLGEISEDLMKRTAEFLKNISFDHFPLMINRIGYFEKYSKPTAVWLGLKKSDPLQQLYSKMKTELEAICNQSFGKKFLPHLTLGRIKKSPNDWKDKIKTIIVKKVMLGDIVLSLKSSTLTETGPIYKALETKVI